MAVVINPSVNINIVYSTEHDYNYLINEGTLNMGAKSKVAIASCHLFDIIKFTAWAKTSGYGPWENA